MENIEKQLLKLTKSIDDDIRSMEKDRLKNPPKKLPSNFQIMMSGLDGGIGIPTLFSPKIDEMIGKLFDGILSGNYGAVEGMVSSFENALSRAGTGKGPFEGELSQRIIQTVSDSVNSSKFARTRGNLKKCLLILKDLKKDARTETDPEKRKKLDDARYAIKEVLKIVSKIYSQRKRITKRVKDGLNIIVNEESNQEL